MRLRFLFSLFLLFGTGYLYAQTNDITFRAVSPPGGFSFEAIRTFNQDKCGYIWMGGFHGVIRYDSKETLHFTHNPNNKNSLPSDKIIAIVIDHKNTIWVGTNKGLASFNPTLQQFTPVTYTYENGDKSSSVIKSIELDGDGKLWIADNDFFGYLDKEKKQLIRITQGLNSSPQTLHNDSSNRMWLGAADGSVYLVLPDEKRVQKKVEGLGSYARTIFVNNEDIWVGYEAHGARLYDFKGNLKKHYKYTLNPEFNIESESIRKIWRDSQGRIWIGSYHGLFLSVGEKLIHFNYEEHAGLLHNSIYGIYEDRQGGIWIGTWSGGVAYIHQADNKFNNYRQSKEPGSISGNMVNTFSQDQDGRIFVGTGQGGLNEFDVKTGSFKQIELANERVFTVKSLCVDDKGGLWVASAFKGIHYRAKNSDTFIHFKKGIEDGKHISEMGVYSLCKSDSGMWIGTLFGGLNFYNFQTKQISFTSKEYPFSQFINKNITSLSIDSKNNLWASTLNGVYRIHLPSNTSTCFSTNSISNHRTKSQSFYCTCELSDQTIWMASRDGDINIYDPKTDTLSFLNTNRLLKGKNVYGIIEGQNNNIWITTDDGLILYNSHEKSFRKFVIADGIQGNIFNPNSVFKDRDKNLYFGGTNGFSQLKPRTINKNTRAPNVLINEIKINNRKIQPKQTGINTFGGMELKPKETTLQFHFSADNYLLPEKNRFMYRLTNYVDQWVPNNNDGTATFLNLPAGEYIFEVKACNNDGVWNETPARLPIKIRQYWYKSKIILVLYVCILFTILFLIIRFYTERSELKKAFLLEKIKHDHEDELNEMKLRFFTNISHEFRTPLTLISWPLKNLLKSKNINSEEQEQLETIKRNTNRLLQLINQIMDLRKAEKGQAKLNLSRIELVDFVNERFLNFVEEAKANNITFTFKAEKKEHILEADEEKLDKIIYNLLSNAFKFTPKNGQIAVSLQCNQFHSNNYFSNQLSFGTIENEDFIEILVVDNGQGIDSEDLPNIFDRFKQGKHEEGVKNSTGIGLNLCKDFTLMHRGAIIVQTTPKKGTQFSIQLPSKQKAQKVLFGSHKEVKNINSWESSAKLDEKRETQKEDAEILVVEDNDDLRSYIVHFIQNHYTVFFAKNGVQALEKLKTKNIQLVVSDVMMPEMDGFELCKNIKSQLETSHIPVILLTALSSAENTSTGLEKGADAYISKPFDENVLLSQIRNLLLQRKRLQESYTQKFISKQAIDIGSLDNYFLNKVNTLVEKNMETENFNVDVLAKEIGLSRSQLHRKLKQISSQTPSEYINMIRIKQATILLTSKNYNIDEVAFKCGFNSHSYFTKCFKRIHNKSPKEYLKSLL